MANAGKRQVAEPSSGATRASVRPDESQVPPIRDDNIRVLLVDDHAVVRAGLRAILATAHDITIVGEEADGAGAVAAAARDPLDVIVMDLSMGPVSGLEAIRQIVARHGGPAILVLTMHDDEEHLRAALDAGASGYLVKNAADRALLDAIRTLALGRMYVQVTPAGMRAERRTRTAPGADDRRRFSYLSDCERDILRLVAEGYSGIVIGARLDISAKTVDTCKHRIAEKLGIETRPEYVQFALRVGMLKPAPNHVTPHRAF